MKWGECLQLSPVFLQSGGEAVLVDQTITQQHLTGQSQAASSSRTTAIVSAVDDNWPANRPGQDELLLEAPFLAGSQCSTLQG